MFKGTYHHRIDGKGRVPVPATFRRLLDQEADPTLVVTRLDQCLAVYSSTEWARLEDQLRALPAFSGPVKALTRLLASRASDCPIDQQGRILLPSELRQAASLRQDVTIVGVLNRFEVWAPERWKVFVLESERLIEDAALDVQWPLPPAAPGPGGSGGARGRHPQEKPNR